MSITAERILHDAMALEPQEREALAEELLRSLHAEPGDSAEAEWVAEAERRLDAIERGEVALIPGAVVMEEARRGTAS
jgi:putative addiction module component (TIGR02574 family)